MSTAKKTDTEANEIATGLVSLKFSALKTSAKKYKSEDREYRVTVEKWHTEPDAESLAKTLKGINKDIVRNIHNIKNEENLSHQDNFIFTARSSSRPLVYGADGTLLSVDEIPMIESGTARLLLAPFEGKGGMGGGINLVAVKLIDYVEFEGNNKSYDPEQVKGMF